MITAHGDVTIQRPIEEVFDFLADSRNEPSWIPGATRVEKTTPGPLGFGTQFQGEYAHVGTVSLELVEFERPYRVTFRARSRIVHFDDAVVLTSEGASTRLQATMEARARSVMKLMEPIMSRSMRTQFEENWNQLKRAIEARELAPRS